MQLPLPENWNGRLLNIGDGAKSTHFQNYDNVGGERDEPRSRRSNKEMGPSRPNLSGGWELRAIFLSLVVADVPASSQADPPLSSIE